MNINHPTLCPICHIPLYSNAYLDNFSMFKCTPLCSFSAIIINTLTYCFNFNENLYRIYSRQHANQSVIYKNVPNIKSHHWYYDAEKSVYLYYEPIVSLPYISINQVSVPYLQRTLQLLSFN